MPKNPAERTLYLLRHAKSSWDDPALADHDRPLAPRGHRAAATIAGYVRERGIDPDLVVCSPALRTRQTLELVADGLPAHRASGVELVPGIYEASGADLLAIVRRLPDEVSTAMLIGHQPGIQDLALTLVGAGPGLARISGKFPTAALATVAVASAWNELGPGSGRLLDVAKPKQLQG